MKPDYKEQIKSPKWQKRRLEILQRDSFTCQICGATDKTLHVHHLTYNQGCDLWDYSPKHLITLCEDCHSNEHNYNEVYNLSILLHDIGCCGITSYEVCTLLEELIGSEEILLGLINKYEFIYGNNRRANILKNLARRRREVEELALKENE